MPACGASVEHACGVALSSNDGIDDGRAQSGDEDDRDPLQAGGQGRQARILDELCATTGWHRDHARKALRGALGPGWCDARTPRPPKYGPNVVAALIFCWAVLGHAGG